MVSKSKAALKAVSKSATKGRFPAKYCNPKTGETWSGHARPPKWIANVKDRSIYLIAGAGSEVATEPAAASKKKTATKKAAAAKTPAKNVVAKKDAAKKALSAKTVASTKAPVKKASLREAVPVASKKASANGEPVAEA
ncbi:H-NS family nucleoid-associated regulatory protein [Trinickia violacea]|uniref:H-NS family nucleoid-associated regulatory protein n=1 Tax=Trinickia violacea TaxID=2571746 RepID=UPI0020C825F3|nr:H-NS family nucleoid-associated regulatory protein [Trinickia violacea]